MSGIAGRAAGMVMALGFLSGCVADMPAGAEAGRGPDIDGAALFAAHCAACHGDAGRGDGTAAAGQRPRPADLTRLSARAGGSFPMVAVMGRIYGYGDADDRVMPRFDALVEGETVLVETDPGIMTPTPLRLVELAEHIRGLQR